MKKVAIITSGGDGSGINSAIEMISRENMIDLYGFHDGFKGILNNDLVHLTNQYCQHNSLNGKQLSIADDFYHACGSLYHTLRANVPVLADWFTTCFFYL